MTRLLTLVALSLAMAVAPAFGEAGAQRLHVTAKIVEQTFTGDLAAPQIGDKLITPRSRGYGSAWRISL